MTSKNSLGEVEGIKAGLDYFYQNKTQTRMAWETGKGIETFPAFTEKKARIRR